MNPSAFETLLRREPELWSATQVVALDEAQAFPDDQVRWVAQSGLFSSFVPKVAGGSFSSLESLIVASRSLAYRDLTSTVACGHVFLGAIPVWISGSNSQQEHLGGLIRQGTLGCLALTERNHGTDLAATETEVSSRGLLSGEKWPIQNATRGRTMTLLAQTHTSDGQRDLAVVLVDKDRIDESAFQCLPKVPTHGIRGADISGIQYSAATLGDDFQVGSSGRGYLLTLQTLQLSRVITAGFSFGCAYRALAIVTRFLEQRSLYGNSATALQTVRCELGLCWLKLFLCEIVTHAAARISVLRPRELSVWSALVKYLVPTSIDEVIRRASKLFGARYYFREGEEGGLFQKLRRDHEVVALFDGSTAVNLSIIASQLGTLLQHGEMPELKRVMGSEPLRRDTFWSGRELGPLSRGRDGILSALDQACESPAQEQLRAACLRTTLELRKRVESKPAFSNGDHDMLEDSRSYCKVAVRSVLLSRASHVGGDHLTQLCAEALADIGAGGHGTQALQEIYRHQAARLNEGLVFPSLFEDWSF